MALKIEEFLETKSSNGFHDYEIPDILIEFAESHVKAALKKVYKKARVKEGQILDAKFTNSILNSYSLKDIK